MTIITTQYGTNKKVPLEDLREGDFFRGDEGDQLYRKVGTSSKPRELIVCLNMDDLELEYLLKTDMVYEVEVNKIDIVVEF